MSLETAETIVTLLTILKWLAIPFLLVVHQIIINNPKLAARLIPSVFGPPKKGD